MNQGNGVEAEAVCTPAAAKLPDLDGKLLLGDILFVKREFEAAAKQYSKVLSTNEDWNRPQPAHLTALVRRAYAYFEANRNTLAEMDADRYLKYRPDDVEMMLFAADVTSSNTRRLELSRRLVQMSPDDLRMQMSLVNAHLQASQAKEAIAAADRALEIDPKSDTALTLRGYAYIMASDHDRGEKDLMTVVRRLPKDPFARVNLAEGLITMHRYTAAIEAASEALKLDPGNVRAYSLRSQARLAMGDGEGALADDASARKASGGTFTSPVEEGANIVIQAQRKFSSEGVAAIEADRVAIIDAVTNHLRGKCGYYKVPDYEDNEKLNAYRDCVVAWKKDDTGDLGDSLSPSVITVAERFFENEKWLPVGERLRCSNMPRKARCIDDATHARAEAALKGVKDPRILVGSAEFDRLNREVDVFNTKLERAQKIDKYVTFMQALSDALAAE